MTEVPKEESCKRPVGLCASTPLHQLQKFPLHLHSLLKSRNKALQLTNNFLFMAAHPIGGNLTGRLTQANMHDADRHNEQVKNAGRSFLCVRRCTTTS
jgi:hypothetical protein